MLGRATANISVWIIRPGEIVIPVRKSVGMKFSRIGDIGDKRGDGGSDVGGHLGRDWGGDKRSDRGTRSEVGLLSQVSSMPALHEPATFAVFGDIAGRIGDGARVLGLEVPGFQSLPAQHPNQRVIRRAGGGVMVAVRLGGRTVGEVLADLVDGVVWVNGDDGRYCGRATLLEAAGFNGEFLATNLPAAA
jgi:hypothetical protein